MRAPATSPYASATLPEICRYVPAGIGAGGTSYVTANTSVVSPKANPVLKAVMLASRIAGLLANLVERKFSVPSVGRP